MGDCTAPALLACVLAGCASMQEVTPGADEDTATENPMDSAAQDSPAPDGDTYSDHGLRTLVARYSVDGGESVDYAAWKNSAEDMRALTAQVELIARISPNSHPALFPTEQSRRSYWINAYNTLVLAAVLDYWPLESVRDVKLSFTSRLVAGKGFFYDRKVVVGGKPTNLYDLEKEVLAAQKDPRLHFALNCGSESCPVLRAGDWSDEALDQAARDFVAEPANVTVDNGTVYLSSIFKWYKRDFPRDLLAWLQQYAGDELRAQLQVAIDGAYRTRYRSYDWSLNESDHQEERGGG
jgi:hypothetical protein